MSKITERFDSRQLVETLRSAIHPAVVRVKHTALAGDASTRQYFRLHLEGGPAFSGPRTLVLMQLPQPEKNKNNNFIAIQTFLSGLNLPVPKLHHYDQANGLLFLEDCGDETLETALLQADRASLEDYYIRAVDLLFTMQDEATRAIDSRCPAHGLRFDVDKLMWEMDFMLEHFVGGLQNIILDSPTRKALRGQLTQLCEVLARQPLYFTHRDFHSRNLMVREGNLVMLDFQDARMGPCQYDLASLLRDSYLQLPDDLVWKMVDRFREHKQDREGTALNREDFNWVFDFMSIQRNLKAVGTFAYQSVIKNNDRYLKYIPPTLDYVKNALARQTELNPLREVLQKVLPELKKD